MENNLSGTFLYSNCGNIYEKSNEAERNLLLWAKNDRKVFGENICYFYERIKKVFKQWTEKVKSKFLW